ncbi:BrnA antitoxin family protein [Endozoicomonas sp. 4G]|uniref:BrnA antitoxin family protein n=1 Tax=Endozoicomonas sp. 4G TaxID=2872754 RepID=UPI0020785173|nr:BrnA antitoxin family protein [Endozoicomonas sp. 4G]
MNNLKKVPKFKNEKEEREFWDSHDSSEYFELSKAVPVTFPNLKPSTKSISLRLPQSLLESIKVEANKRDVPYQSLMKVWLSRAVEEFGAN